MNYGDSSQKFRNRWAKFMAWFFCSSGMRKRRLSPRELLSMIRIIRGYSLQNKSSTTLVARRPSYQEGFDNCNIDKFRPKNYQILFSFTEYQRWGGQIGRDSFELCRLCWVSGRRDARFVAFSTCLKFASGYSLSNSEPIRAIHNSFARQQLFEMDDTNAPKEKDSYHFVSYVPVK